MMTAEYNSHYYNSATEGLDIQKIPASISQLHGLVTGFICSGHGNSVDNVIKEISAMLNVHNMLSSSQLEAFKMLYVLTWQGLQDSDCQFELLLPSDERGCAQIATGLTDWADGFLTGLGLGGYRLTHSHDEFTQEALKSMVEITHLDDENMTDSSQNLKQLQELIEFVRVSSIMFFTDNVLKLMDGGSTGSSAKKTRLH